MSIPSWYLNENILQICENFVYLSAHIGNKGNNVHVESRISSCRRASYTLQSAGLCKKGLDVESVVYFLTLPVEVYLLMVAKLCICQKPVVEI